MVEFQDMYLYRCVHMTKVKKLKSILEMSNDTLKDKVRQKQEKENLNKKVN